MDLSIILDLCPHESEDDLITWIEELNNEPWNNSSEQLFNSMLKMSRWKFFKDNIEKYRQYEDEKIKEISYRIAYGLTNRPICSFNNTKKFGEFGYKFCGTESSCKCLINHKREKAKNIWDSKSDLEKDDIIARSKDTLLNRYGVDNPSKIQEVKNKKKETLFNNFENGLKDISIRNKTRDTCILKYGVDNPMKNIDIITKSKNTNIEKYGTEVKANISNSVEERYGVSHISQRNYSDETRSILFDKQKFIDFTKDKSFVESANLLKINPSTITEYYTRYGIETDIRTSSYEREIAAWLTEIDINFFQRDRKLISPFELDFYLPDYKLAIEFNGLYWHSSLKVNNDYHRQKYEKCLDNDIRLIMINEDEWRNRASAIKNRLLNILGKSIRSIGARKLKIMRIDNSLAMKFYDDNHWQGSGSFLWSFGAYYNDTLVSCMSFNKQRSTNTIELIRFSTDGCNYPGVFSKLFKFAVNNHNFEEVISFADLRHSNGDVYRKNGFEFISEIRPDYRYIINGVTYHKSSFSKSNIQKKFSIDISDNSESELMNELGIPRIYDCGKLKFRFRKQQE